MADQMRRREKLRKQDLGAWQSGLRQQLAAAAAAGPQWDKVRVGCVLAVCACKHCGVSHV